jgi:antitoxin (DNA-binding transcriptional repressor) of toxin-antitoxin stability system
MKKGETEISVSELREDLPSLLARVQLLGESFAIMKHGKRTAIIRPLEGGDEEPDSEGMTTEQPSAAGETRG